MDSDISLLPYFVAFHRGRAKSRVRGSAHPQIGISKTFEYKNVINFVFIIVNVCFGCAKISITKRGFESQQLVVSSKIIQLIRKKICLPEMPELSV